jgi:hypothetical protein
MFNSIFYGDVLDHYVKAGSQSCSADMLEAMAHSDVARIRLRVAENPKTPIEILEILSTDRCADVRIAVGTNPSTPGFVSLKLAFDEDPNVRLGLAEEINTPVELLEKLAEDENPYVACRARDTINITRSQRKPRSIGHLLLRLSRKGVEMPEFKYA